ncbi:MAG: transcription termination/antitermination protein NusG [Propionibacteriaceae bacterium]
MTSNPDASRPDADSPVDDVQIDLGVGYTSSVESDEINLDFGSASDEPEPEDNDINLDFAAEEEVDDADAAADAEEADIADKALAELRADLRAKFGDWYVVHTYSGMENRVKQNLENRVTSLNMEDFIFEVTVPTEEVDELRNGQKKRIKRTVLPGYVLVRMELTDESWSTVRHTPSVTGFVGHSNQPIPLSLEEVEKMLAPAVIAAAQAASDPTGTARSRSKKKIEVADFTVGDSVMVVEGPFAGVHATITEMHASNQRLKALVEILGRETPVDLTFTQIQKV